MPANLPNILTLSRIVIIPLLCLLLMLGTQAGDWLALGGYVYACVTDFLDGYIARTYGQQSSFGRMLDPIADKLLVAAILLILVGIGRLNGTDIIAALIILCREIVVSGLREYLAQLRVSVPVTQLAKWKTTLQMIALGFLIVGDSLPIFGSVTAGEIGVVGLWLAAILTLVTGYDYLRAGLVHVQDEDDRARNEPPIELARRAGAERAGEGR